MAFFTAVLETTEAVSRSRRKPSLVIRGLRRKIVRKLKKTLEAMVHQDEVEQARATRNEYIPMLVRGNENSLEDRAIKRLLARCQECLDARS